MKFWKFEVNGNDFLLFYRNHKHVDKIKLCNMRKGAGANGWIEVALRKTYIAVQVYAVDGSEHPFVYDGFRCCALWYMERYHKDTCTIQYKDAQYRLKRFRHLITLEVNVDMHACHEEYVIKDAMHFVFPNMQQSDVACYMRVYADNSKENTLYRIALGEDLAGKNVLRLSNRHMYISAVVHFIYEGRC